MAIIAAGLAGFALAAGVIMEAFQKNLVFFFTPSQVAANEAPTGCAFLIGGMVETGSVLRQVDRVIVHFAVTDTAKPIDIAYRGVLPDLFREGKGAVVQARLDASGHFIAGEVRAKHDENYRPSEAVDAIKQAVKSQVQAGGVR